MMNATATQPAASPCSAAADTVDLVDLLYQLSHLRQPDRFLDRLVELLVHRRRFDEVLTAPKVRFANWLESEIPAFTQGGPAINVLAAKLGYRVSIVKQRDRFIATASDIRTRRQVQAHGYLAGSAGILALIRLALQEKRAS